MTVYLMTYDLVKERDGRDYKTLYAELKRLGGHRTMLSAWLVNLNNTAREVREHFEQFVDGNDRLWLTKLRPSEYTFTNAMAGTNDWLKANPPG